MRPHLAVAIVQIFTLRLRVQSYGAKVALGLAMLTPLVSAAQIKPRAVVIVAADTVAIWTNTMRVGTLAARDTALAKLAALPVAALPAETQRAHDFAATQGVLGRYTVVTMEQRVIPSLTALAASRSTASLASGLARLVTAVCGTDATGRRHGTCQSLTNEIAAASQHLARGQSTPARNGFENVGKTIDQAFADGVLGDAEHALLAGNVAMVLQRLAP